MTQAVAGMTTVALVGSVVVVTGDAMRSARRKRSTRTMRSRRSTRSMRTDRTPRTLRIFAHLKAKRWRVLALLH
jgi:hypothetical protein